MKQLVYRILFFLRIFKIINLVFCRNKIVILMYHGFSDTGYHNCIENSSHNHVYIEYFKQQVGFLKKYYNVISLNEALEILRSGSRFKNNTIVMTIDDGYKSVFSLAFPVLKEFGVQATVFCTTNFIRDRAFLWGDRLEYAINTTKEKRMSLRFGDEDIAMSLSGTREKAEALALVKAQLKKGDPAGIPGTVNAIEHDLQACLDSYAAFPSLYLPLETSHIKEMEKSELVSFGAHTASHAILSRCTIEQMEKELKESKSFLGSALRAQVNLFCYPNGQKGDFNDLTAGMVKKTGFICAVTTIDGMNNPKTNSYELRRYWVRSTIRTIPEFALLICGFLSFMERMKIKLLGLFS
jgi:peptidoglycan/xylan/chitin deacetylase (PgdA/CDA1 family)